MQLSLLDYTPPLAPPPQTLPPVPPIVERSPSLPRESPDPQAPFAIGAIVECLPRPIRGHLTTTFAGRAGVIVRVDPELQRSWVHFGVANHPCPESWICLQKCDRPPNFWPNPVAAPPVPVCWLEWRWSGQHWHYTGTMGRDIPPRLRRPGSELFPTLIDPNKVGARP